jgi:hypothetical protein
MKQRPDPRPPRACHHEQQSPASCVAACACTVKRWLGEPAREADIRAEMRELGVEGLWTLALVLGWRAAFVDWDEADEREALFARLALGTWLIVDVYPGFMTMHAERLAGPPVSRHGPLMPRLTQDEDLRRRVPQVPHHAIVLVEEVTGGFRYLDPWFPKKGQPFFVGRADFAMMWTGLVVKPGRDDRRA